MVIDDILWKLFRKSLSPNLYEKLRLGPFGRPDKYLSLKTYEDIFNSYVFKGLNFKDKTVVEIGPGLQFYTSCFFLTHGAKRVILIEPAMPDNYADIVDKNLKEFNKEKKVECFKSLNDIPSNLNSQIDVLCSNFVLEHFSDLNEYFNNTARLLKNLALLMRVWILPIIYIIYLIAEKVRNGYLRAGNFIICDIQKIYILLSQIIELNLIGFCFQPTGI